MRYYAILDTNVLVSAMLKSGSAPGQVTAEALNGDIFLDEIKKRAVYSDYGLIEDEIPDLNDIVFYAVLMEKRKEEDAYLITGNIKHFPIRTYIVTPREMLDIIEEGR